MFGKKNFRTGKKETQIKATQHALTLKHHPDLNISW